MVSNIGWKLNSLTPISGFGMRRRYHPRGRGITRRAVGSLVGHLGHALVNRVSRAISGGSYKLTGHGATRKRVRKPRATLVRISPMLLGGRRKVRRPRATLYGGRRRRVHHRVF